MFAPLIADLAACTFKQDRAVFERQLVGEQAFFSDKGLMALATADALYLRDAEIPALFKAVVREYYNGRDVAKVHFPKWFGKWCSPDNQYHWDSDGGMSLPMCCVAAPIDMMLSRKLHSMMLSGKASGYAVYYFGTIIDGLKRGQSKEEVIQREEISMLPHWIEGNGFGKENPFNALNSLVLAWKAFESSDDLPSAIKNAAALGRHADTRVITMMAATMAEVCYHPDLSDCGFPEMMLAKYGDVIDRLKAIEADDAKRKRIEVELTATHSF